MFCLPFMFVGCSEEDEISEQTNNVNKSYLPSTKVYVQGWNVLANDPMTRADYQWPLQTADGYETARFYIRIDGKIPGYYDQSAGLYFGRTTGGNNVGKIYPLYPYGHYNDRNMDYYQKDKRTGENIGLFRYVYDVDGLKTQLAIMEQPTITEILTDDRAVYEKDGKTDKVKMIDAYLAKGEEYLNKHVLWYVVKEVGMQYGWHVDGVFVDYEVPDYTISPDKVSENVEIDIHQQEHQDWNEIKTSVHIRADVESITINLPISEDNIVEQDDFAIRVYGFEYDDIAIKNEIKHDADGITYRIYDIPASLIEELKNKIGDGLTVEIHSYCKKEDNVWEELKKSKVVKIGKTCTINGQITSAYNDEKYPIYLK